MRGTRAWPPTGLIPWFSETEGNTYATLLHHPFLFKGKPTQCSRGNTPLLESSSSQKFVPMTPTPISEEANDDDHVTSDQVTTEPRR